MALNIYDTLILHSKDKESVSNSNTDFIIKLKKSSVKLQYIQIAKIIIPLSYDNISASDGNNTLTIGGVLKMLPDGYYSKDTLLSELNAQTTGFSWSFENESRFKVTDDTSSNFNFVPGKLGIILGFTETSYSGASSYQAEQYPNLAQNKSILTLHSSKLKKTIKEDISMSDERLNLVSLIPIISSHGDIQVWEPHFHKLYDVSNVNINILDFQVRDEANKIVDLQGKDIIIVINRIKKKLEES